MAHINFLKLFSTYGNNQVVVAAGSSVNSDQITYKGFKRPTQEYYERVHLIYRATAVSGSPTVKVSVIQSFDSLGEDEGFDLVDYTLADGKVVKKNLYGDTRMFMNTYFMFKFTVGGTGSVLLEGVCAQR